MKPRPRADSLWRGRYEHNCGDEGNEEGEGQCHGRERTENEKSSFHGCRPPASRTVEGGARGTYDSGAPIYRQKGAPHN